MLKLNWERLPAAKLRPVLLMLGVISVPLVIFSWHLRSQTVGFSLAEVNERTASKASEIFKNPLFAPYKIIENLIFHLTNNSVFGLRLTSVIFSLVLLGLFFYVLKIWFGKPIATLTVLLLALTPLYLINSRLALPNISYIFPLALIFAFHRYSKLASFANWLIFVTAVVICLYTPGLIWFLIISAIVWRQSLFTFDGFKINRSSMIKSLIILLFLAPLAYAFIKDTSLITQWLLIPAKFGTLTNVVKDIVWAFLSIFIRLPHPTDLAVGRLAVLDVVQIGLFVFGLFVMWSRLRKQFYWLVSMLLAVILLEGVNGTYEVFLISLPIIAFICGMGLRYLFIEWRKVFPRNPLAKTFAIVLMFGIISMHVFYGFRYSLLAWPTTSSVRQIYVLK